MGPIHSYMMSQRGRHERKRGETRAFRNYADCAAAWIRQQQSEGRAGKDRMYFQDRTIYSYRSNWPLARIVYAPGNVAYVLLNVTRISPTTSRHLSEVRHAVASYMGAEHSIFETSRDVLLQWNDGSEAARYRLYAGWSADLAEALGNLRRARCEWRQRSLHEAAWRLVREGNRFARAFGDAVPFPTSAGEALTDALALRRAA